LDVAIALIPKFFNAITMGTLPGLIVDGTEDLAIERRARVRKHRYRLADPDTFGLQAILPGTNLRAVVVLRQNQVSLYPGNALAGINQKFRQAICCHPTAFIQLVAAFFRDRLNSAFQRNTVSPAQEIQCFFVPEINTRLKANTDRASDQRF